MCPEKGSCFKRTVLLVGIVALLGMSTSVQAKLVAAGSTPNSITLTWTAPGDDGSVGIASQYDIRYSTSLITEANWAAADQVSDESSPQAAGSIEQLEITGLEPSTTYFFVIKTADEVPNWSELSNVVSKTTSPEETPPATLTDLAAGNPTVNSLTLTWTAPGDDGNTGTASQYDIRYSTSTITEGTWDVATQISGEPSPQAAGNSESMAITGLSENTTYYFAIKTVDEVPNWSDLSNIASATTTNETTPPAVIANLGAGSPTMSSLTLTWTAPGDDGMSGTASQYDIRYSTSTITDVNWDIASQIDGEPSPQIGGSFESLVVTGLSSSTTYYFAIKTADEVPNWSGLSIIASSTTLGDTSPPGTVSSLLAVLPAESTLTLVWIAPGDNGNVGTASEYDIRYSKSTITESNWNSATQISGESSPHIAGTPETLLVGGLTSGNTYYFALKTSDEVPNWSELSNVASNATSGDATPPAVIDDLSAVSGSGDGEIDLAWTAPGDDGLLGAASLYLIRYSEDSITADNWESATIFSSPPSPLPAGSDQAVTITDLQPAHIYYLAMRAYDDAGNPSGLSNVVSAEAKVYLPLDVDETLIALSSPPSNTVVPASRPVLVVENNRTVLDRIYQFELATDSNFFGLTAAGQMSEQDGPITSWKVPVQLSADRIYYWRVATNGGGVSDARSFSVAPSTHAYPNPVRFSENSSATFTDLKPGSELILMSISGSVVRQWTNLTGDDVIWNGSNESGHQVASGTYLWYVTDAGEKGKLIVVR